VYSTHGVVFFKGNLLCKNACVFVAGVVRSEGKATASVQKGMQQQCSYVVALQNYSLARAPGPPPALCWASTPGGGGLNVHEADEDEWFVWSLAGKLGSSAQGAGPQTGPTATRN
jgi:hypothetical protein